MDIEWQEINIMKFPAIFNELEWCQGIQINHVYAVGIIDV